MRTTLLSIAVLSVMPCILESAVAANVYKCKDENGQLIFSDKECSENPEILNLKEDSRSRARDLQSKPFYCPSGITAVINNLHYPTLNDVETAVELVEKDYTSLRYRKMIKRVDPADELPERVSMIQAEGFLASEVPGFSNGVVVNVRVCK